MTWRRVRIGVADTAWHDRFFHFVRRAFDDRVDFVEWALRGGWDASYEVFAIAVGDEIVSTSTLGPRLVRDVLAAAPFDLRTVLPRLTRMRISRLEFRFDPEAWWPDAAACPAAADDAPLFVRGLPRLRAPLRFPDLART
jgi:hypothetical protein